MLKIKPVIKWTGGKYKEYQKFQAYIPTFERYFEPFFGGGGVYFAMQPHCNSFLNDKSKDLIKFYRLLQSLEFKNEMLLYADAWDEAGDLAQKAIPLLLPFFKTFMSNSSAIAVFYDGAKKAITRCLQNPNMLLLNSNFIIFPEKFIDELQSSVLSKGKRLKQISAKKGRLFNDAELAEHIETSIKSGLYMFLRNLTNLEVKGSIQLSDCKAAANWYFVREFCYASMFRYSRQGGFNIPYGGIAYNNKNFRQKVNNIFSKKIISLFDKARFYNLDFEDFLRETDPRENDFIFLDPPYDSEFSEYDQNVFSKDDQLRLRDFLFSTPAKWMVVIKETDFIRSIYTSPKCRFIEFDKTYTYNVRGRNNRQAKHLIIINYEISDLPKIHAATLLESP